MLSISAHSRGAEPDTSIRQIGGAALVGPLPGLLTMLAAVEFDHQTRL
jgi:hypothetical protein